MGARSQLRIYRISPGKLKQFLREWRTGVAPLRENHGFRIDAAWTVEGEDRFVWIMTYDGGGTFEEADAAYYSSPERHALQPDPARHITEQLAFMITPI